MKNVVYFIIILCIFNLSQSINAQTDVNKKLVPTVTIPAPKGSKGFGMPSTGSGNTTAPGRRWVGPSITEEKKSPLQLLTP